MSGALAVLPYERALADIALIRALNDSRTLGEVRRNVEAWQAVADWGAYRDDLEPGEADGLPDDTPYDFQEWFAEPYDYIPFARLRTAEACPAEILADFGREDHGLGLDYIPATWLSPEDQGRIEETLLRLGYSVVHDDALLKAYLDT